jgi:hypothetical protein
VRGSPLRRSTVKEDMPKEDFESSAVTSPYDAGLDQKEYVGSLKEFSDTLTLDLTDADIKRAFEICMRSLRKWRPIFNAKFDPHSATSVNTRDEAWSLIMQWDSEIHEQLGEMDLDGEVDIEPLRYGQPPTIVINGALESHDTAKWGLDHERKSYEVRGSGGKPIYGADDLDL